MGRRKVPPIIGRTEFPPYFVRFVGTDHLIVAGGGGAAKTGVCNRITAYLLHFGDPGRLPTETRGISLTPVHSLDTAPYATMNADLVDGPVGGDWNECVHYLAAGQDDQCAVYSCKLGLCQLDGSEKEPHAGGAQEARVQHRPSKILSMETSDLTRFRTDFHSKSAYQKCVSAVCRTDSSGLDALRLATAGADGCIRLWGGSGGQMLAQMEAAHKGEVDSCSLSANGEVLLSIGNQDHRVALWDTGLKGGKSTKNDKIEMRHITDLGLPVELAAKEPVKFRPRFAQFTALGVRNLVFLVSYVPVQRGGRSQCSYLALCAFDPRRNVAEPIRVKVAIDEVISCMTVSSSGAHCAIGTMQGSVRIYDTHTLTPLHSARETHGIFVTGVTLAPDVFEGDTRNAKGSAVALAAQHRATCVSVSADLSIQVHCAEFGEPGTYSYTASLWMLLFVLLCSYWGLKLIGA